MKIVALGGGVGAAKLLWGVAAVQPAEELAVIVNTGDDFEWQGLYICPDIDTVIYTLSGVSNPDTGWGIAGDTFHCLERMTALGWDPWFRVGDRDLATHVHRSNLLKRGCSLTEVTRELTQRSGVVSTVLPMTEDRVPTMVHTSEGTLEFQDYFVRRKCAPRVLGFTYTGAEASRPAPGVIESLKAAAAVLVCPSNPFVSIGPILAVPGIRSTLREIPIPIIGVTPMIGRRALKGPTATMLEQLGHDVSAAGVARLYQDFLDIFVVDRSDVELAGSIRSSGLIVESADTRMDDPEARIALAKTLLEWVA